MRTAFVLAGGGSLGAVQVGMLRSLTDGGVKPDLLVGASVGSINAACYAAHGAARLEAIWSGIGRGTIFPVSPWRSLLGAFSLSASLVDPSGLRRLIERNLGFALLEDAPIPLHAVATDAGSGEEVLLSRGPAVEALLASAAIPAVFPPVAIAGRELVDGGVACNTPIAAAARLGAERVVVLPAGYACAARAARRGPLAGALHALNQLLTRQLVVDAQRFRDRVSLHIVPPLCPQPVRPHDFSRTAELIARAARRTTEWLDQGALDAPGGIPAEILPHRHD